MDRQSETIMAIIILSIAVELGGLINVVYGGWLALLGAALAFAGTRLMIMRGTSTRSTGRSGIRGITGCT